MHKTRREANEKKALLPLSHGESDLSPQHPAWMLSQLSAGCRVLAMPQPEGHLSQQPCPRPAQVPQDTPP